MGAILGKHKQIEASGIKPDGKGRMRGSFGTCSK